MFLEMYLKIIVTIIVNSETSKYLAKQASLLSYRFVKSSIYLKRQLQSAPATNCSCNFGCSSVAI